MKDETKRLIELLWASKGHMIVGSVVGIAGIAFAMRGAYWEGAHAMLAGLGRIDLEKSTSLIYLANKILWMEKLARAKLYQYP